MIAWIGIASSEHVAIGRAGGFMQVCHGKQGPLNRMRAGDRVFYYSPSTQMGGGERLQSFTAAGTIRARDPYSFAMSDDFVPFRRDIDWLDVSAAPIQPLLDELDFTRGKRNWGYAFRFGVLQISLHDADLILDAMQAARMPQMAAE